MSRNLNQELFDLHVEHLLRTRRYDEGVRLQLERASGRHRKTLRELLKEKLSLTSNPKIDSEVTRYVQELFDVQDNAVKDFLSAELDFQVNSLKRTSKDYYRVQGPSRGELARRLTSTPLKINSTDRPSIQNSFAKLARDESVRVNSAIRRGLAAGVPEAELVKTVLNSTTLTEVQARTLVSTNLAHAEQLVKEEVARLNPDLISGFVFTAILDSRTSKLCSGYDGLFQATNNVKIRPPLHYNCRSKLVPVLSSKTALETSEDPLIKRPGLESLEGATGELPARESFEDWLRRQAFSKQVEHLGSEERASLFQNRTIPLGDFVNRKGISLATLRTKDALATWLSPRVVRATPSATRETLSQVSRPFQVIRSKELQRDLADLLVEDSLNASQSLSLIDYRGTTLAGKRGVRHRAANELDERNTSFDPFTGESRSTLVYDPDYSLFRERLDYMRNSKLLDQKQKDFIETFAEGLEGRVSTNQQTAVVENLRLVFERYQKERVPWEDFTRVVRAEMNYSVINTSQLLDSRSRARSELFLKFRGDPKRPALMISGEIVPVAELQANKLVYERYVRDWANSVGRNKARGLFYRLNSPWRTYFLKRSKPKKDLTDKLWESFWKRSTRKLFYRDDPIGFYTRYGKTPDSVVKIIKKALEESLKPGWWKKFKEIKDEGLYDFLARVLRENYQSLVALERFKDLTLREFVNKKLTTQEPEAILVLGRLMKIVAEGTTTDYDSLAITLGREVRTSWPIFGNFMGSSLQDFHEEGSKILEHLRAQGAIRVNSRGVTRRAVVDLDTGRTSGDFKDTVSREVQVLDPDMLRLQDYNRRIELTNRLGVDREANRYWVRPRKKTYYDARGNDTGISIVTRSASKAFDEKTIDGDFADMLNHTMGVRYAVDPDFASFMDDLARFRDVRGRAKYYDELNTFREEIIRRGDQGYGLLESLRYYLATGREFSNHARIDSRGRLYFFGYLSPTGGEVVRPFLNSATPKSMTPEGLFQLRIQTGTLLGPSVEALTDAGRLAIFERHEKSLRELGGLLQHKTQRDRRIREFLEHPLVRQTDGAEVAKLARFALEYKRLYDHTGGKLDDLARLRTYKTQLVGEADASASAIQMIALATGNRGAAVVSNLIQSRQKNRVYDLVAMDTLSDPRFQKLVEELGVPISFDDLSKASKYQVISMQL